MKSVAVWDKKRGDEEGLRAICGSPTEEDGWNGEREALSFSMQTLSESESLAEGGKRGGEKKMEEMEADKWDGDYKRVSRMKSDLKNTQRGRKDNVIFFHPEVNARINARIVGSIQNLVFFKYILHTVIKKFPTNS